MPTAISDFVGISLKFKFFPCNWAEIPVYAGNKSVTVKGDQESLKHREAAQGGCQHPLGEKELKIKWWTPKIVVGSLPQPFLQPAVAGPVLVWKPGRWQPGEAQRNHPMSGSQRKTNRGTRVRRGTCIEWTLVHHTNGYSGNLLCTTLSMSVVNETVRMWIRWRHQTSVNILSADDLPRW